ncbi:flagellar motor protein MotB [Paenibacillus sp. NFR01]|uniref:flagellar motor protein MotB n=1 Tax=Paenibacillus sp. NFR01 TaxID=1566279 RepID=UPI0008C17555|nr:flagellar motor protein MotB [Paenibacillus sp. NFR01]SEU15148.1 chemotaxis protein MotB [Paenibacillus sp. NFR01]
MKRRGRQSRRTEGRENRDRWMITYADLITLLLIFFVILYAMSSLDTEKYKQVSGSLSQTFANGNPVLEGGNGVLDGQKGGSQNGQPEGATAAPSAAPSASPGTDTGTPTAREIAFREQEAKLSALMGVITKYVEDNNLGDQIFVADKPQGIAITLSDRFLFDVGKAELKSPALPALRQLSGLFRGIGATVSIEGHTDNTPVSAGSRYSDNWELSGARALSVLRFFLDNERLDPDMFQYAGYADTKPAADNATAAGRQKNRRVELIVLRQLQEE